METCKDRFYIDIKRFLHSYYRRATQWNVSRSLFIRSKVVDIFVCRSQLQKQQSLAQLSPEFVFCYILQVNNSYTVILRPRARVARVSRVSLLLRSFYNPAFNLLTMKHRSNPLVNFLCLSHTERVTSSLNSFTNALGSVKSVGVAFGHAHHSLPRGHESKSSQISSAIL